MEMAMNQSEGEDRLSALPDAILIEILSLLPFDSVIVASTLSHHLQSLSTQLSSLTFHPRRIADSDEVRRFWISFKSFSCKLNSPLSSSFILHLPPVFFHRDCPSFSDSWFRQICGPSVHTIQLSSHFHGCGYYFVALSNCVFQMESLKVLELGGCFGWSLPSDTTTIRLPNLNKLRIHVACYQFKLFGNLISSLPSLEDLSFWVNCHGYHYCHRYDVVVDHVSLSSPNLKRLYAKVNYKSAVIVIDSPALEYLKIASYSKSGFYFVQKPALLVEAALLVSYSTCACCEGTLFHVLKSVSNVRRLVIKGLIHKSELTYPNLTTLVCKLSSSANLNLVDVLVKNCPVLQVVKLALKTDYYDRWSFPNFIVTHLKVIELKVGCFIDPINFIKRLLSKACVLEQLNINIINGRHISWQWKSVVLHFFKGLVEYQEKLLRCHIEFSGFGVNLSCNGSKLIQELSSR